MNLFNLRIKDEEGTVYRFGNYKHSILDIAFNAWDGVFELEVQDVVNKTYPKRSLFSIPDKLAKPDREKYGCEDLCEIYFIGKGEE